MDGHEGHGGMHDESSGMEPMPMYFINTIHTTLWFKNWETTDVTTYAISLVGLLLFAVLHEGIACYRSNHLSKLSKLANASESRQRTCLKDKALTALLYTANVTTGYLLMLAVMTFNVGYFLVVLAGLGLGYFVVFDYMPANQLLRADSCHVRLIEDQ